MPGSRLRDVDRPDIRLVVCPDAGHGPSLDRIFVAPNVCLGQPCICRHRIWSSLVIDLLASGMSVQDVISEHGIEENDVLACIAYGAVTFGWKIHTMTRAEPAQRRRQS
ncbi:DUF433 domain-containing protein [Sorangium sp. So ce341]|uniref:DUF433 domain-containing protein n=1 Tax=Sorangium sp. So ce341 TaxID=3133302 RepID=UPI003F61BB66